jgi:hypothetical protein
MAAFSVEEFNRRKIIKTNEMNYRALARFFYVFGFLFNSVMARRRYEIPEFDF